MSKRKIAEYINKNGNKQTKVYYCSDYVEFIVRFYVMGSDKLELISEADYYTNDKADAMATAIHYVKD